MCLLEKASLALEECSVEGISISLSQPGHNLFASRERGLVGKIEAMFIKKLG